MKIKHIYSTVLLALLAAACTNDDFNDASNNAILEGEKIDATNFALVETPNDEAQTRVDYLPGYFAGSDIMKFITPTWKSGDDIGFSHIYPTDQRIVTNYKFTTTADGVSTGAKFTTDNSTIFAGDYFVYYPFNVAYADYEGIPFELPNIQAQDASEDATVNRSMDLAPNGVLNEELANKFRKAGAHLVKFSISNRVTAEAHINQTNFSFNQYTSQICYLIYPKNQTNTIAIKRVELVSDNAENLQVPTAVRFNSAGAGVAAPVAKITEYATNAVLLFDNVQSNGNGGLEVEANVTKDNAVMGYLSMIPATYTKGTYKFVVYYTENNILKRVQIRKNADLVLTSNKVQPITLEIDANGAEEVTSGYDIYTETEFASAVVKSNAVTSGASEFNLACDITLKNSYELNSKTPVTFKGDKKINIESGKELKFNSEAEININNTINGEGTVKVSQGKVAIDAINSDKLTLINAGELAIKNAEVAGNVKAVTNTGDLTLKNATVAADVAVETNPKATVDFDKVNVKGTLTFDSDVTAESNLKDVTVNGNVTNEAATLIVKGNNVLAYESTVPTIATLTNNATINLVEAATATIGNLANNENINLGREETKSAVVMTVMGTTTLATSGSLIYVDEQATLATNGALTGLKGNGDTASSSMILEGTLETAGDVTLSGSLAFCGKIVNKAGGHWKNLQNGRVVSKFTHSHATKPTFINEAGAKVTVSNVNDVNSTAAMNAMPKDLYDASSEGTLLWQGIDSAKDLNDIYNGDCWATDLSADLVMPANSTSAAVTNKETFTNGLDWSEKNIILNVKNPTFDGDKYQIVLGTGTELKAANLDIVCTSGASKGYTFEVTGGLVNVENKLNISGNTYTEANPFILNLVNGAECVDLEVNNVRNTTFYINNGTKIQYTGNYIQAGCVAKTHYPNGTPQKK